MKNNLVNLIGGGSRMLIFLVTIPLLIKFMGLEKYGLWILLTSIGNVAMLLDSGLTGTSMFFVSKSITSQSKELNKVITSLFLINSIIVLIIISVFASSSGCIRDLFFSEISFNISGAIVLIGVYSSILISHNVFIGIIQSYENFLTVNIIKFSFLLLLNSGLVILVYNDFDFFKLTLWMVFCSSLALLFYIRFALYYVKFKNYRWIYSKESFKEVTNFSLNTWLGYAGNVLFNQMDKIILGLIGTPYILGAYAAIISITTYINSLATVGLQPLIPQVAKLYPKLEKNKVEIFKIFSFSLEFNTAFVFSLGLLMMPFLSYILYGIMDIEKNAVDLPFYFFIAIVIYSLNSLYVPGFYSLMAIKESRTVGRIQFLSAVVALFMVYILGNKYGLLGAIIGNGGFIISYYFNFKMSHVLKSNYLKWINTIIVYIAIYIIVVFFYSLYFDNLIIKLILTFTGILTFLVLFFKRNIDTIKTKSSK